FSSGGGYARCVRDLVAVQGGEDWLRIGPSDEPYPLDTGAVLRALDQGRDAWGARPVPRLAASWPEELAWQSGTDPLALLDLAAPRLGERRLRLFACAAFGLLTHRLDRAFAEALEATRRYADGLCPKRDMQKA